MERTNTVSRKPFHLGLQVRDGASSRPFPTVPEEATAILWTGPHQEAWGEDSQQKIATLAYNQCINLNESEETWSFRGVLRLG